MESTHPHSTVLPGSQWDIYKCNRDCYKKLCLRVNENALTDNCTTNNYWYAKMHSEEKRFISEKKNTKHIMYIKDIQENDFEIALKVIFLF